MRRRLRIFSVDGIGHPSNMVGCTILSMRDICDRSVLSSRLVSKDNLHQRHRLMAIETGSSAEQIKGSKNFVMFVSCAAALQHCPY